MTLQQILLQTPAPGGLFSTISGFLPIVLIIVVFYFFMIRPQMKKQKDQNKFKEEINKGDKIVTIGGIHGKIIEVQDRTFTIEVEGGNKLKIEKSAVSMETTMALQKANGIEVK